MNKLFFLSLAIVVTAAGASDSPLQRCRALVEDRARLACYDAIPANAASPPSAVQGAARASNASGFGLPAPAAPAEELRSRVVGHFGGWDAQTVLRLENGQHWQIVDGSRTAYSLDSPQVRIERSVFGGYLMVIDGVAQRPRVRRVR
jgi:hypothetical protein